jgi:hypothetical protein
MISVFFLTQIFCPVKNVFVPLSLLGAFLCIQLSAVKAKETNDLCVNAQEIGELLERRLVRLNATSSLSQPSQTHRTERLLFYGPVKNLPLRR